MASALPIAVVIGATGAQGGSVARALAGKFQIRTLSRDPSKPAAHAIKRKLVGHHRSLIAIQMRCSHKYNLYTLAARVRTLLSFKNSSSGEYLKVLQMEFMK